MPVYTIKPLTWQDVSTLNAESQHFRAKTACGDYDVWFSPIGLKWEASGSERWQFDFDSADAAKAAAESWYRERLATALTPSPLAEAAREALECCKTALECCRTALESIHTFDGGETWDATAITGDVANNAAESLKLAFKELEQLGAQSCK
jgi:hypothetical protein